MNQTKHIELSEHKGQRLTAMDVFSPWELDGESRRDSLPHRANLLKAMSYISIVTAGFSVICMVTGFIGLFLGLATWIIACRDLELMRNGEMNRSGFHQTCQARADAKAAMILSLIALSLWVIVVVLLGYQIVLALFTWGPGPG